MKKKIAILLAFLMVIGLYVTGITNQRTAYAKTAQLSMEIPNSIKKENEFKVRILLDSDVDLYSIDAFISYDEDILEFIPDCEYVTGSAGVLELRDSYEAETKKKEYELTFRALDTGKAQISFQEIYLIDYADMDYIEVMPSSKTFDIGVNKKEEKDARLADLIVAPGEMTEDFSSDKFDYEMNVGMDVDMVCLSAVPMEEGSIVESDIPEKLKPGKNTITIKVTAMSGNVNVYTINVYKKASDESAATEETFRTMDDSE